MSTHREAAQFIDELRQHYRRLDGLLVRFRDRVSTDELWDVNLCVLALRRLLFGGIGDPNFPPSPEEIEKRKLGAATAASTSEPRNEKCPLCGWVTGVINGRWVKHHGPPTYPPRRLEYIRPCGNSGKPVKRLALVDAPTAPMSVHDPAEDLEVIP